MDENLLKSGEELYQLETMADGMRNNGYKSIYNALAELVDNSAEEDVQAKNIFIIGTEEEFGNDQRISKYAVLDDGLGMTDEILSKCLKVGFSTRRERKGMGRFGVGLPQASFFASPRVEVYTWQDGIENAKCVFVDLDLVSAKEQTRIYGPYGTAIPKEYNKFVKFKTENKDYDFSKHGTLVVWPKCDKVQPKRWSTCRRNMAQDLGRKYRWLLNDKKIEIAMIESNDTDSFDLILPNDPLFLMRVNQCCVKTTVTDTDANYGCYNEDSGYTESLFEPYTNEDNSTGVVNKEVFFIDRKGEKKTSYVTIRFSIVKEKYYSSRYIKSDPGSLPFGKYAKSQMGISIVRQGREIDFGKFDFYDDIDKPNHRWWGCEISFASDLDEAFGISNNKQQVDLRKVEDENISDYDGNEPIWLQLKNVVSSTISKMYAENKERRKGARTKEGQESASTALGESVKNAEAENPDIKVDNPTRPKEITPEVLDKAFQELVKEGYVEPTEDQIKQYLDSNTRILYKSIGSRNNFIDYDESLGVLKIIVNIDHQFYQQFVSDSYQNEKMQLTFELFLASLIKSIHALDVNHEKAMSILMDKINALLKQYLRATD